jgi:6,7-dimethyl-8-ribityllumazine synthase
MILLTDTEGRSVALGAVTSTSSARMPSRQGQVAMLSKSSLPRGVSRTHISDMLLDGRLRRSGRRTLRRLAVPSALEIPTAIALAARGGEHGGKAFDGYIALGCTFAETYHSEIVASRSARSDHLGIDHGLCIGNGILTVENERRALVVPR